MMIFPRLARDVERQRTYLDSQLISFQTSSFFAKAETIPRLARFILPPFPPQIFFENIGSHRIHHFCTSRRLSRASLFKIPSPLVTLSNNYIFQLAVVHLVSRVIVGSSYNLAFYDFIAGELHIRARVTV